MSSSLNVNARDSTTINKRYHSISAGGFALIDLTLGGGSGAFIRYIYKENSKAALNPGIQLKYMDYGYGEAYSSSDYLVYSLEGCLNLELKPVKYMHLDITYTLGPSVNFASDYHFSDTQYTYHWNYKGAVSSFYASLGFCVWRLEGSLDIGHTSMYEKFYRAGGFIYAGGTLTYIFNHTKGLRPE
jgi:hypothetical protein